MEKLKRINVNITEDMHKWLKSESERRGLTMNALVIFALETYHNQQRVLPHLDELMAEHERMQQLKKD